MIRKQSSIVRQLVLIWGMFCLSSLLLVAQDQNGGEERLSPAERLALQEMQPRIGFYGGLGLNLHAGSFFGIPEAPACCLNDSTAFGGDLGFGFGGGFLFELPLSPKWFMEFRAGYSSVGANLKTQANIGPVLVGESDTASGISEYLLDAGLSEIGGSATIGWRPISAPVTFRLGPQVGFFVGKSFTQQEELTEPSSGAFIMPDGSVSRIRNQASGDIAKTTFQVNALLGVDYELPMNADRTLLLVPELTYSFPFAPVRSDLDWYVHQIRAGVALKYSFPLPKPVPPIPPSETPAEPPPPPSLPVIAANVKAVGVTRAGVEEEILQITVEEFINTQTHAMLNYIFFEENSSTIPTRYVQYGGDASSKFNYDMLRDQGTLAVYHQILNIIGARMKADPAAKITLTGTNANEGVEEGNRALSKGRAESVKNYLTERWGIEPGRIDLKDRNLPSLPSNPDSTDGDQENRRVEIVSNRESLLEPVTTDDTLRTVDPPTIRVKTNYTADAGIENWSLQIRQGPQLLKEYSGEGNVPEKFDWNIEEDPSNIPRRQQPLTMVLSLRDGQGQTESAVTQLPVEQITIQRKRQDTLDDIVYDRFNLITFEFNSAKLSPPSKKIAKEIRDRIKAESTVKIVGYSDRLGEAEHNLKLSTERAQNTAKELRVPVENAVGGGENTELYNNDLPEGRFYSRTVGIVIETPVN
ncbi:MAG: OmpA family protein [Candidatus Kapaibacterium sp.]